MRAGFGIGIYLGWLYAIGGMWVHSCSHVRFFHAKAAMHYHYRSLFGCLKCFGLSEKHCFACG